MQKMRSFYHRAGYHSLLGWTALWKAAFAGNQNDYSDCLTVYPSEIAGLNCINVALVLDADTFSVLSGGKLTVSAVCTEDGLNDENRASNVDRCGR